MDRRSWMIHRREVLMSSAALALACGGLRAQANPVQPVTDMPWVRGERRLQTIGQTIVFEFPTPWVMYAVGDGRKTIYLRRDGSQRGPVLTVFFDKDKKCQLNMEAGVTAETRIDVTARAYFSSTTTPRPPVGAYTSTFSLRNYNINIPNDNCHHDVPPEGIGGWVVGSNDIFDLTKFFEVMDLCTVTYHGIAADCNP